MPAINHSQKFSTKKLNYACKDKGDQDQQEWRSSSQYCID